MYVTTHVFDDGDVNRYLYKFFLKIQADGTIVLSDMPYCERGYKLAQNDYGVYEFVVAVSEVYDHREFENSSLQVAGQESDLGEGR